MNYDIIMEIILSEHQKTTYILKQETFNKFLHTFSSERASFIFMPVFVVFVVMSILIMININQIFSINKIFVTQILDNISQTADAMIVKTIAFCSM